jgi:hypothetical protein
MPIDKPYAYHKPSASGYAKIRRLRQYFSDGERLIRELCPESRYRSMAITHNEEAAMWAVKAVVFNDPDSEVEASVTFDNFDKRNASQTRAETKI